MVLQSRRNLENAPPSLSMRSVKSIGHRIRSGIRDPTRTRRLYRIARSSEHAKRKSAGSSKSKSPTTVQFNVTSVSTSAAPIADVEMRDAEPLPPKLTTQSYRLPRELLRPAYQEVSRETLLAVEPDFEADIDLEYAREVFEDLGPGLYRTVASVVADPPRDSLPKELTITVTDDLDYPAPTHLLAIHAPASASKDAAASTSEPRRQVTLIPVHSAVLALHCARLPPFAPSPPPKDPSQPTVPVQPLCLPSPATFPLLSAFIYTKRTSHLFKSLLPTPPPPTLTSASADRAAQLPAFAASLASTYTAQALLRHVHSTHGLWQNACVLGVHDDALWDAIDLAWEVLLTAMAISAGTPQLMIKRLPPPSPPPPEEPPVADHDAPESAAESAAESASESGTPAPI